MSMHGPGEEGGTLLKAPLEAAIAKEQMSCANVPVACKRGHDTQVVDFLPVSTV